MHWRRTTAALTRHADPLGSDVAVDPLTDRLPGPLALAVDDVVRAVGTPGTRVVELVGPPGAGKSTVLRHVALTLLERGHEVTVAHPRTSTDDGAEPGAAQPGAGPRGDGLATVRRLQPAESVVGVVDDAHHLDGGQSTELQWALERADVDVLVLATARGADVPSAIENLRGSPSTHTTHIRPFGVLDTMTLLADMLGGPVAGDTAARVQRDTGGRPGLVVELCRRGLEEDVFGRDDLGRHQLVGELPIPWTLTVASVSDVVPPAVRAVLRLLAVADAPVPVSVVESLTSSEAVRSAVASSAVVVGDPRDGDLTHASPWVGAGIRAGLSEEQRQDLLMRLGTTILSDPAQPDVQRVRALRWLVRSGCPPPVRLLPEAVSRACRHGDHRLAQELVELAGASGLSADEEAVRTLGRRLGTIPWRHGATTLRGPGQSVLDSALDLFLRHGRVDDLEHVVRGMSNAAPSTRVGVSLAALRTSLLLSTNRVSDAVAASDELPLDRVETLAPRVAALVRAGRPVDAVRAAQRLEGIDSSALRSADFRHTVYSYATVASAYSGGLHGARQRAREQYEAALLDDRPAAAAPWAYAVGLIEQLAGPPEAALAALTDATGLMGEVQSSGGPTGRAIALVALAMAQLAAGSVAAARETLAQIDDVGPVVRTLSAVGIARGMLAHADGDDAEARAELLRSARQSAATGAHTDATWAYVLLAYVGGAREAARHMSLTARLLQGPVLLGMYDAVRAMASGSSEAVARVAVRLDGLGMTWFRDRLLEASEPPDPSPQGRPAADGPPAGVTRLDADRRADVVAEQQVFTAVPPRGGELTERQRQVASLVADGLTNSEVAARLGISRRTVEVHLQLAYDKLGVHDRRLLAQSRHLIEVG